MALSHEFEKVGNWFFQWRSYLPLLLLILISAGFERFFLPTLTKKLLIVSGSYSVWEFRLWV